MPTQVMVVIVVGIIFTFLIARMGIRHEERKLSFKAGKVDVSRLEQIMAATQAELARLKDRVQVLEKLVTDDDRKLADEIERLRRDRGDDIRG